MWISFFIGLLILWLVLKFAVGVASFGIHVLLGLAIVALIIHFVRGSRATV